MTVQNLSLTCKLWRGCPERISPQNRKKSSSEDESHETALLNGQPKSSSGEIGYGTSFQGFGYPGFIVTGSRRMTCPSSTRKSRHRHGLIISYGSNDKFTHRKPSAKSHDTRRCITTHFHHRNQIEKRNRIDDSDGARQSKSEQQNERNPRTPGTLSV